MGKYKYIDLNIFNLISIDGINPFKTYNKIKKVFKPLKWEFFRCRKIFLPIMFYRNIRGKFIDIQFDDVLWKDKYDTPRFEQSPYILITLFNKFHYLWLFKLEEEEQYWEQALWWLYYYNTISYGLLDSPDIKKAKESWPWYNVENDSTWKDEYLNEKL